MSQLTIAPTVEGQLDGQPGSYRAVYRISTGKRASVDRTDQLSDGQLGSAAETALSVVPEGTATEVRSAILGSKHCRIPGKTVMHDIGKC
jgi:hypothetical protein